MRLQSLNENLARFAKEIPGSGSSGSPEAVAPRSPRKFSRRPAPSRALWIVVVIGVAVAAWGGWQVLVVGPIQGLLASAQRSHEVGDYPTAVSALESVLARDPGNVEAVAALARVKAATGDNEGALELYARAVAAQPNNAPVAYDMALLERLVGRPDSAVPHFEAAYAADPTNRGYLEELMKSYMQAGQEAKAAKLLAGLASEKSRPASERKDLYIRLASVSAQAHDVKTARSALREALHLVPRDPQATLLLKRIGR